MQELVATSYRHGGREEAEAFFMAGMSRAIGNMARATAPDVPVTVYYAFKQAEIEREGVVPTGWATFLEAVLAAGFQVDGTWPMRTELANRMIGRGTNALASSIVLVCRRRADDAPTVGRAAFLRALRRELPQALGALQASAIAPVDMGQAAIGPGMAVFSRYAEVLEADDAPMSVRDALALNSAGADAHFWEREGDFDGHTRFAVAWYAHKGFEAGAYGEASTMATGKNVSVEGARDVGFLEARGGRVRLLRRDELDQDWDPRADPHLTVWACCQHLIRRLEAEGGGCRPAPQGDGALRRVGARPRLPPVRGLREGEARRGGGGRRVRRPGRVLPPHLPHEGAENAPGGRDPPPDGRGRRPGRRIADELRRRQDPLDAGALPPLCRVTRFSAVGSCPAASATSTSTARLRA